MHALCKLFAVLYFCISIISAFPGIVDAARGGSSGKGHKGISHPFGGKHGSTSSKTSSTYKVSTGSKSKSKSFYYKKSKSSTTIVKGRKYGTYNKTRLSPVGGYKHVKYSKPLVFDWTVKRDSNGHIVRSETAKHDYLKMHGYNKVPAGYQVDHIVPLYAGGADRPSNMQLLSNAQHLAKTKADYQKYGR